MRCHSCEFPGFLLHQPFHRPSIHSKAEYIVLTFDTSTEAIPNNSPLLKPSSLGDVATYFFFGAGGLFVGGETGLLTDSGSATRTISSDPESRARIEAAFKKFRADV
jgi:hypothetical protein